MEHGITHARSQKLIDFACAYAEKAHGEQKRKYTGEQYINHPVAVAKIVASVTDDCNMICAALLHDVIEDTDTTWLDLNVAGFGFTIANLVDELTDISTPEDGNRATRKAIDKEHLASASRDAQTIKLADLINNSESILKYDPKFAKVYIKEKRALLKVLIRGDYTLLKRALKIVEDYYETV